MLIRLTLLFVLIATLGQGQSWLPQYESFFAQVQEQNYEKAITTGSNLLNELESIHKTDTAYADVSYYLAYIEFSLKDYEKAAAFAHKERTARKVFQGADAMDYLNATYFEGISYGYQTKYDLAIPLMEEVASSVKRIYGPDHIYYLHYSDQLAASLNQAGSYHRADEIFTQNLESVKRNYTENDSIYRVVANAVSVFYTTTGNYTKSEPFFLSSLKMLEKNYGKNSKYYIETTNALGEFYIIAGWYDKAEKTFEESVTLCEIFYGKNTGEYATAINNLAVSLEKQGKNEAAEKAHLKSLSIKEKLFTKKSDVYALSLTNLCVLYDNMGLYKKAEKTGEEAVTIYKELYGSDNENYATALGNLGSIYSSNGKNKEAEKLITQSKDIYKKLYGQHCSGYIIAQNNLANIHVTTGEYTKAEKEFEECVILQEKVQGKDHTDLGTTLFNLANLKTNKGNFTEAEKLLERALAIQINAAGKYDSKVAGVWQSLANVYASTGRYSKAENAFNNSEEIYIKTVGKLHPQYAVFLGNKGLLYAKKGEYEKAEKLYNASLKIQIDAYGAESPENVRLYANMASIKLAKDDFKGAEKLYLWCNNTTKEKYGTKHPDYISGINSLASLYAELGNYNKAKSYYEESIALGKELYGDKHPEYANAINNLGALYLNQASDAKTNEEILSLSQNAINQFKISMAIDSANFGANNIEMTSNYNNLAEAYRLRNETKKAETNYLKCLDIEMKNGGEKNSKLAVTYHNLALLYAGIHKLDTAENFALKAINNYDKNYGSNSNPGAKAVSSLAYIYEKKGKNDKAEKEYLKALSIQQNLLEQNFTFLSEEETEKFINSNNLYNDLFNTFALKIRNENKSIVSSVYNNELRHKSALLKSSSKMKNNVLASNDTALINLFNTWIDLKEQLAQVYATPIENRNTEASIIETRANSVEKQLVEKSSEIKSLVSTKTINVNDIKNNLLPNQAAIEFTHFTKQDPSQTDVYCALIMRNDLTHPEMVELFTAQQLNDALGNSSSNTLESVNELYGNKSKLFNLIWEPLEKYLNGINEIYYAPAGLLNKISFASLHNSDGKYVSAKYTLHTLTSTANIVNLNHENIDPKKEHIAMFGGINYNTNQTTSTVWKYLPGTLAETQDIKSMLTKSGMIANAYTGTDATEAKLKELNGKNSPEILHVATHGFFFGDPEETKKQLHVEVKDDLNFRGGSRGTTTLIENSNSLMRSGIVLAGANDIWNENNLNTEDGVLTAYEVSLMNLQNTRLTVLSACETGLGDIKGSEGVYGLQRAFKIAGVKQLIMSLWQVPDKETEEFMVTFYSNLLKEKNIDKAFASTQKFMRSKYEPYYWGAFVLIE